MVSDGRTVAGSALVEMSVAEIKRIIASGVTKVAGMDPDERALVAAKAVELFVSKGPCNPPVTFGGYRLSIVETPDDEIGQIIAGGAFGLSAYDVIYECRDYTLTLMSDETEETAMRRVIPSLLLCPGRRYRLKQSVPAGSVIPALWGWFFKLYGCEASYRKDSYSHLLGWQYRFRYWLPEMFRSVVDCKNCW
ncbi:hypothetical protein LNP17_26785 [Klebsiella variicola subsp. variicola]|nr:hypothetical protein [Klebsiella variicola subsp. variicola]